MEDNAFCSHGYPDLPEGHICRVFMHEFEAAVVSKVGATIGDILLSPADLYNSVLRHLNEKNVFISPVCGDLDNKDKLLACLIAIGVRWIVCETFYFAGNS